MFESLRKRDANEVKAPSNNYDVAKLFFDTFSGKLNSVETYVQGLAGEMEKLKRSSEQSKLSDLVLLERLQKSEKLLGESLNWIKQVADLASKAPTTLAPTAPTIQEEQTLAKPNLEPTINPLQYRTDPLIVQPGSLNSITTPTELQVLTLLADEGPKSAPEIGKFVGRSREHTARLMKKLFDEGYVRRDQARIPFRYSAVERVKQSLTKPRENAQPQETAPPPQV